MLGSDGAPRVVQTVYSSVFVDRMVNVVSEVQYSHGNAAFELDVYLEKLAML